MGALIWTEWSNLLAITSSLCSIWGSIFAFFIRRYFFNFLGEKTVKAGSGIIAGSQANLPIFLIVRYPVVQAVNIFNGLIVLALEMPLPFIAGSIIQRSIHLKILLFIFSGFTAALLYQTFVSAIFYGITVIAYSIALGKGERIVTKEASRSTV